MRLWKNKISKPCHFWKIKQNHVLVILTNNRIVLIQVHSQINKFSHKIIVFKEDHLHNRGSKQIKTNISNHRVHFKINHQIQISISNHLVHIRANQEIQTSLNNHKADYNFHHKIKIFQILQVEDFYSLTNLWINQCHLVILHHKTEDSKINNSFRHLITKVNSINNPHNSNIETPIK